MGAIALRTCRRFRVEYLLRKVLHHILVRGIGVGKRMSLFHQWDCLHSKCDKFGIEKINKTSGITILPEHTTEIDFLE